MSEVLRDFQCKLCSKLLGSRAALQRHCKEVHSRNSTVVSCPRCQKLFQNRSNLKIHMLTHSGVRPFKCAEIECTAAFTTKQCLQFHYKKVHNYSQEQMPKIERSVAYTFDAYSGGMKVDFLEQTPRRRRKSLDDQNSILSSTMMDDSKSESDYSEDNTYEKLEKSSKPSLCPDEANLTLLATKISSIYHKDVKKINKKKYRTNAIKGEIEQEDTPNGRCEKVQRKQTSQISLVESFLSTTTQRLTSLEGSLDESHKLLGEQMETLHQPQDDDNNYRHTTNIKENFNQRKNLVVSKGSKKWIGNDDRRNLSGDDSTVKLMPNRDFLARFLINNADQSNDQHEEDENSTFLDVVDSNNPRQISQFHESQEPPSQLHINPITHSQSFISSFYNTGNTRTAAGSASSTSASLLVEAALNSVGSLIENESNGLKCTNSSNLDSESNINAHMEVDNNRFGSSINNIESIENEIKMMKNLNNFPIPIPSLPMFHNAQSNLNACNVSPNTPHASNAHNGSNNNSNEIDVDSSSTTRDQQVSDQEKFSSHQQTPPSPQAISPGRDYSLFATGDGANNAVNNNMSSPIDSLPSRRNYPDNELISPASSPSMPRYDFNDIPSKGTDRQDLRGQNQLSSDDDSVITQNKISSPTNHSSDANSDDSGGLT